MNFLKAKYEVLYSNSFKKDVKKVKRQGKDITKLDKVINDLSLGKKLDAKYKNHKLNNNKYFIDCMECHIEPDWLLVYKIKEKELILLLVSTGSHSKTFK